ASRATTDFSQGVIELREDPWSLALEGSGFFAVETPSGEAYTRNGSFHVDDQGELLTADGFAVAWEGGRARLQPAGDPVTIDGAGTVPRGSSEIGRLKIVDFADPQSLRLDGRGIFHAPPRAELVAPTAVVHQNALERSNGSSIDELVSLIKAQRGFETAA